MKRKSRHSQKKKTQRIVASRHVTDNINTNAKEMKFLIKNLQKSLQGQIENSTK